MDLTRGTVFLLVGLPGSGKTTYARALEEQGVVRLSVDEEVFARHGRYAVDYPGTHYRALERPVVEEVNRRLVDAVRSGGCVVLDYGLWLREERDAYKKRVQDAGGRWRLIYLKVDRGKLLRRLHERNRGHDANCLHVSSEALDDFIARFQEPVDEGQEVIYS
jgi:predicted kinase